tara:strand:- start:1609 stop:2130 length:522 start_codon:yes stop_codon:yes gene_type:complete
MKYLTMNSKTKFSDQVDFRTPKYLFEYIKSLYGYVHYDGACFPDGSNALSYPLRLEEEWPQGIIYSNPPFDDDSIIKWINKGWIHSRSNKNNIHIMLIPNKLNHVKIQKNAFTLIDKIIFLGGRVDFKSEFAVKGGASRNGSIILIQDSNLESFGKTFTFKLLSELKEEYNDK